MSDRPLRLVGSDQEELDSQLSSMTGTQVVCRSGYHQFEFDTWDPTTPVPRSVTVMHAADTRYKFLSPCTRCHEATRVVYTHAGGRIDGDMESSIVYGSGWHKIPSHLPRTKRAVRAYKYRIGKKQLEDALGRAVAVADDGDDRPAALRPRFQGA